jgi:hypothetical protein
MAKWNRPTLLSLAILTFLVFPAGAIAYLFAVAMPGRAAQAEKWPEVACEITESRVDITKESRGRTRSEPIVRYRYEVDGTAYTGSTIKFVDSHADVQQVIRPYPKGLRTRPR